jgi:hypothetical protein
MVLPVHLRFSAVVAIVDCPDQGHFIDSRSLKQAALQSIWLFQESLRRRTERRCAPGDLACGLGSWFIFAEKAGFFSKPLEQSSRPLAQH